jgi:multidrug efflux pump subunit AcrB
VDVNVTHFDERKVPTWTTLAWMQQHLSNLLPGWKVKVKKQQHMSTGKPIEYEISGEDFEVMGKLADSLMRKMEKMPQLTNVTTDYNPAQPQVNIQVDREQAKRFGLGTTDVAMAVRNSMYGIEAGKYRVGEDEWKVMVRLDTATRESFRALDEITIPKDGARIPLLSVATVKQDASIAIINRVGRRRTVQVTAELAAGQKDERAPQVAMDAYVKKLAVPAGYIIGPGSGRKDQAETTSFLGVVFVVAVALVFMMMVIQFNSIFLPMLILLGVVLALGGVFWGLLIVHTQMSIMMTGIGIIALAGIVAKNGIVLIDYMNHLKAEGLPLRQVALEGGKTRLRPVMLTAVTAMIALVPMATGKGIDFVHLGLMTRTSSATMWAPLAWAIFWGLLFNTILVLVVTPVMYYTYYHLVARLKAWRRLRSGKSSVDEAEGSAPLQ